jgi:hypothetical protein
MYSAYYGIVLTRQRECCIGSRIWSQEESHQAIYVVRGHCIGPAVWNRLAGKNRFRRQETGWVLGLGA